MDRNKFVAGRYIIEFMSVPKRTPEDLEKFFQRIMDDSKSLTCEEIRNYMKTNMVAKLNTMVDRIDIEIEAAIDYLENKAANCPDQLTLQL